MHMNRIFQTDLNGTWATGRKPKFKLADHPEVTLFVDKLEDASGNSWEVGETAWDAISDLVHNQRAEAVYWFQPMSPTPSKQLWNIDVFMTLMAEGILFGTPEFFNWLDKFTILDDEVFPLKKIKRMEIASHQGEEMGLLAWKDFGFQILREAGQRISFEVLPQETEGGHLIYPFIKLSVSRANRNAF